MTALDEQLSGSFVADSTDSPYPSSTGWGKTGDESADLASLIHRFAPQVERRIRRMLGPISHNELADLVQDVFVQALSCLGRLRDPDALAAWMNTVATHTSLRWLRTRRAEGWLRFQASSALPELGVEAASPEVREAWRHTCTLLARMPPSESALLVWRYLDQVELRQLAERCDVSLATVKRRLKRAHRRFMHAAARDTVLRPWLEQGRRWQAPP